MNNEEHKLLTDPEYREQWVKDQLEASAEYFMEQLSIHDSCTCDCERNYSKACKYPEKYRKGGCS